MLPSALFSSASNLPLLRWHYAARIAPKSVSLGQPVIFLDRECSSVGGCQSLDTSSKLQLALEEC